jgi:hypothetical protein
MLWLLAGGAALAALHGWDSTAAQFALILPAIPLALLAEATGDSPRSGWLWDSAHGPPFLNLAGVLLVYFLPGLLVLAWLLKRRADSRRRAR